MKLLLAEGLEPSLKLQQDDGALEMHLFNVLEIHISKWLSLIPYISQGTTFTCYDCTDTLIWGGGGLQLRIC